MIHVLYSVVSGQYSCTKHVPTEVQTFLLYFAVSQGAKVVVLDINGMLYLISYLLYSLV